jgi:hypothetical protein
VESKKKAESGPRSRFTTQRENRITVYKALCEKRFAGMLLEGKQAHTA